MIRTVVKAISVPLDLLNRGLLLPPTAKPLHVMPSGFAGKLDVIVSYDIEIDDQTT